MSNTASGQHVRSNIHPKVAPYTQTESGGMYVSYEMDKNSYLV